MKPNALTCFLLTITTALGGCAASYSNLTFTPTIASGLTKQAPKSESGEVTAEYAKDFGAEVTSLYERGFELVGYSKFTAGLVPRLAPWNAKFAARSHGASYVLLAPPEPAKLRQHHYLFTYWRRTDGSSLIGAQYGDANARTLGTLGCSANLVRVLTVAPDSPAAQMGLRRGDTIASVDDTAVFDARQLDELLRQRAGQSTSIRYIRDVESRITSGKLGKTSATQPKLTGEPVERLGISFVTTPLNAEQRAALNRKNALFVTGVNYGSIACTTELRYGDLLLAIGDQTITEPEDIASALASQTGTQTTLSIWRGQQQRSFALDLSAQNKALVKSRSRLPIAASQLAQPPWQSARRQDFTWAMITVLAAQGVVRGYANLAEEQRRRADAYNRAAAARVNSAPVVSKGRNGRWTATKRNGQSIRIDGATAQLLKANPGYTITGYGRRGNNFSVYDTYGNQIPRTRGANMFTITPFQSPDLSASMNRYAQQVYNKHELDSLTVKNTQGGGPFVNSYMSKRRF